MTLPLFLLGAVCVVNAARSRTAVRGGDVGVAALGAVVALLALVPLAVLAEPLLDAVSISAPTFRIATGLLLVAMGILAFGSPGPGSEPGLAGRRAAVVPIAFPTVLTPGLGALVVAGAVDHSAPVALALTAVALATVPMVVAVPRSRSVSPKTGRAVSDRILAGVARLLAAVLAVAGLALLFDGVYDI